MLKFVMVFLLFATSALAEPTATEQALGQRLLGELNRGVACEANVITLTRQLEEAKAEVKRLTEKKE